MEDAIRRNVIGLLSWDLTLIVAGDVLGEYTSLTADIRGQVIRVGAGETVNPLDCGPWTTLSPYLTDAGSVQLRERVVDHRVTAVTTLLSLVRGPDRSVSIDEAKLLTGIMHHMTATEPTAGRTPTLSHVVKLMDSPPALVAESLHWLTIPQRHRLRADLVRAASGSLGDLDSPTTTDLSDNARIITVDISAVPRGPARTAALTIIWQWVTTRIDINDRLATAGATRQHRYLAIYPDYPGGVLLSDPARPLVPAAAAPSPTPGGDSTP